EDGIRYFHVTGVQTCALPISAGALVKRIAELRGTYIYGDGVMFDNVAKAKSAIADLKNQEVLFSTQAQLELNRAHATDGNIFILDRKSVVKGTAVGQAGSRIG